ncbi:hypothetical protein OZX56_01075 [Lactobacillus sp. ESL0684]|uniref:hypothetical protein n=1 Tax=Lactobacillus sp. ESL0684 TaxID=2983213 RepID=UPI0023F9FB09|nr:hypothetical protein [Lactobacillus sp. ESL0684]WEV43861.1 hypothetical protein OZX56_01075 [Lactobacillus sp. ESL0684]
MALVNENILDNFSQIPIGKRSLVKEDSSSNKKIVFHHESPADGVQFGVEMDPDGIMVEQNHDHFTLCCCCCSSGGSGATSYRKK